MTSRQFIYFAVVLGMTSIIDLLQITTTKKVFKKLIIEYMIVVSQIVLAMVIGWYYRFDTLIFQAAYLFKKPTNPSKVNEETFRMSIILMLTMEYCKKSLVSSQIKETYWMYFAALLVMILYQVSETIIVIRSPSILKSSVDPSLDRTKFHLQTLSNYHYAVSVRQLYPPNGNEISSIHQTYRIPSIDLNIPEWLKNQSYIIFDPMFNILDENLQLSIQQPDSIRTFNILQKLMETEFNSSSLNLDSLFQKYQTSEIEANQQSIKHFFTFVDQSRNLDFLFTNVGSVVDFLFKNSVRMNNELISIYDPYHAGINLKDKTIQIFQVTSESFEGKLLCIWLQNGQQYDKEEFAPIKVMVQSNDPLRAMFSSISHEMGTTLNCILSISQAAITDKNQDKETNQDIYFESIRANAQILRFVLNNLRDYSYLMLGEFTIKLESFKVEDSIQACLDCLIFSLQQRNNRVEVKLDLSCQQIRNDSQKFQQIFYQLSSNATRFTKNGEVEISVTPIIQGNLKGILVTVKDTGVGMTSEEQMQLNSMLSKANQFQKISESSVGCGLGLGISNMVAYQISGRFQRGIRFQSTPNVGSQFSFVVFDAPDLNTQTKDQIDIFQSNCYQEEYDSISKQSLLQVNFRNDSDCERTKQNSYQHSRSFSNMVHLLDSDVRLPINFLVPQNNIMLQSSVIKYDWRGLCCPRILIVDDEYFNILSIQIILKRYNVNIDSAFDGKEALEKAIERSNQKCRVCGNKGYTLYFLDINMPIMDGYQTVKELRRLMAENTIQRGLCIANSGFVDLETKLKCVREGMDFYLSKPLEIKDLMQILDSLFK